MRSVQLYSQIRLFILKKKKDNRFKIFGLSKKYSAIILEHFFNNIHDLVIRTICPHRKCHIREQLKNCQHGLSQVRKRDELLFVRL